MTALINRFLLVLALMAATVLPCPASSPYDDGVKLYAAKNYRGALELFKKAKDQEIQPANSVYYQALCYHQLGDLPRARALYRYVIVNYRSSPIARQAFKTLVKLDPEISKESDAAFTKLNEMRRKEYDDMPEKTSLKFLKAAYGHIIIRGSINGVPTAMMFDTGASVCAIKQSFLDRHHIPVKFTSQGGRAQGVGGEVQTKVALVVIQLGSLTRTVPIMVEQDQGTSRNGTASMGDLPLLGQTYFGDLQYQIDDSHHLLTLKRPAEPPPPLSPTSNGTIGATHSETRRGHLADNEVPYEMAGNSMIVTAVINGRECEMIFDTGAASIAFSDRSMARYGLSRPTNSLRATGGGIGGKRDSFVFYLDTVKLGNIQRRGVQAQCLLNSHFDYPLLGQTFLSGMKYTIDPSRKVIIFDQ